MFEMVFAVRDEMKMAYPELVETAERVSKVVRAEEEQFASGDGTLDLRQLRFCDQYFPYGLCTARLVIVANEVPVLQVASVLSTWRLSIRSRCQSRADISRWIGLLRDLPPIGLLPPYDVPARCRLRASRMKLAPELER